jgi:hypothetical protein
MKQIFTILFLLFSTFVTNAQETTARVPEIVLSSFKSQFPQAANTKWEVKKDKFKAEFQVDSRKHEVWLDKAGVMSRHKQDFPKKELPQVILDKIKADFSSFKIDDADKVEENNTILYEVDLKGATEARKVIFTPEGAITKNEAKKKVN